MENQPSHSSASGDNDEILALLKKRLDIGKERYGHGVRVADDTRTWGTKEDSWEEMALEETLDGLIYLTAQILRIQRLRKAKE